MKYALAVFGVIIVAVLAIVLITRKPSDSTQTPNGTSRKVDLMQMNGDGTEMVFTSFGRLVAEEQRRGIRISVSQDERKVEVLTGYESVVSSSQIFPNTATSYDNFLAAVKRAGFIAARKTDIIDERGVCPTGSRFNYNVLDYGEEVVHLWGTSCAKGQGTFAGNASLIARLFQSQIPGYNKIAADVRRTQK